MNNKRPKKKWFAGGNVAWAVFLIIAIVLIVAPLYIMGKYSVADKKSIVTGGMYPEPLWPFEPNADQYDELLGRKDFLMAGFYSLQIAVWTIVFSLVLGVPAAFVLARYKFPGILTLMFLLVGIRFFPDICSVIPVCETFSKWLSFIPGVVQVAMAHTLLSIPYVVFICIGVFKTIPRDLEEQAQILGASKFVSFKNIVLPVAVPGISASAIYVFLLSWNEFIFAYFLLLKSTDVSLPVYLMRILTWTPQRNFLAAIAVLVSLPVIIFTFVSQRYIVSGMTAGSVK